MGMIYIFFGKPEEVYQDGLTEKWYYARQGDVPAVTFSFTRLKNVFSSRHYVLERQESYRSQWFKRVDLWRKGIAYQFHSE
jgi:hypothetical protein